MACTQMPDKATGRGCPSPAPCSARASVICRVSEETNTVAPGSFRYGAVQDVQRTTTNSGGVSLSQSGRFA